MDRHLVISSDCHAGPPLPHYREYVEPKYRAAFDERLPGQIAEIEAAERSSWSPTSTRSGARDTRLL